VTTYRIATRSMTTFEPTDANASIPGGFHSPEHNKHQRYTGLEAGYRARESAYEPSGKAGHFFSH